MRDPTPLLRTLLRRVGERSASAADQTARNLGILGFAVALASFSVSTVTAYLTEARNRALEQRQLINDVYSTYLEWNRLQLEHPEIAHEQVRPEEYAIAVLNVRQAFASLSVEEKARYRLREEAFAFYAFSTFERLVYAKLTPETTHSAELERFVNEQLNYFARAVLPNPRLVHFWRDERGGDYYDEATRRYYAKIVARASELPADASGPFR